MKQKVMIKVSMHCEKKRSKALKIVVGVLGVESAALKGEDKSQIEIIGDGMDAVALTTLLRKKVGYAEIVSVEAAEKKKEDEAGKENVEPLFCTYAGGVPSYGFHVVATDRYYDSYNCSIM